MTAGDELDAIKALTHRLTEWGVAEPSVKAKEYVGALVSRGWTVDATHRAIRRPPQKSEECANHPGEYRDFCRACVADRKAAKDEASGPTERWTPERIRESLTSSPVPDSVRQAIAREPRSWPKTDATTEETQ